MSFRPYPLLTLLTVLSLGVLLWLGNWQYGRYTDKMIVDDTPQDWLLLEGDVVPGSEAIIYSYVDAKSAWRRVVAVEAGEEVVFVDREIVYAVEAPVPCAGPQCGAGETVSLRGLYQTPKGRSAFAGKDDPQAGIYYSYDPKILSRQLPAPARDKASERVFEPETITLTEAGRSVEGQNPFARARMDDSLPPQRHFGYAITWWGLAIALLGVYFALHWTRGRLRFGRRGDT